MMARETPTHMLLLSINVALVWILHRLGAEPSEMVMPYLLLAVASISAVVAIYRWEEPR